MTAISPKLFILLLCTGLAALSSPPLQAATSSTAASPVIKTGISQPYVVKKGDTLWHIADHFFQNPRHWIKVWERNLYITNPDLIYPGNKIWFDGKRLRQGEAGLTLVKPTPRIIIKPVERLEVAATTAIMLTALQRQDFIRPDQIQGVGHILDSLDERLNFGANDRVYLQLEQAAHKGDLFDVFRSGDVIRDPNSGQAAGVLVQHLGQIRITSADHGIYRGRVTKAFEELSRGDRLKPARLIDPHITPVPSEQQQAGSIMYIRNNAQEAAQNQVIGINMGKDHGLQTGMTMAILKHGRMVQDHVTGKAVSLPSESIGQLLILVPQQQVSIALITKSTAPIHIGDIVQQSITP